MHSLQKTLSAVNSLLQKILDTVAGTALAAMVFLIFLQVIFRYVLKHPLSWSEELAQYIFSWLIFAGAASAYRDGKHTNVELALDAVPIPALRKALRCLVHLLVLFFLLVIVYYSYPIATQLIQLNKIAVAMPALKLGYVYLIIPISCIISVLMVLENLAKIFTAKEGAR